MKFEVLDKKIKGRRFFEELLNKDSTTSNFQAISFVNSFSYIKLLENYDLIENIDSFFIDGSLLTIFHNWFNINKVERLSFDFSSIAHDVFEWCQAEHKKVAFVGANSIEIKKAICNIKKLYPDLEIAYYHDGYINDDVFNKVQKDILEAGTEVLICGMGTPLQEEFLLKFKNIKTSLKLGFTCGGFLTQTSIKPDYYHPFIKKTGLRWLQRMIMHSHVRKRVFVDYPKFLFFYLKKHI